MQTFHLQLQDLCNDVVRLMSAIALSGRNDPYRFCDMQFNL